MWTESTPAPEPAPEFEGRRISALRSAGFRSLVASKALHRPFSKEAVRLAADEAMPPARESLANEPGTEH